jgi:hypothetical protein
MEIKIVKLVSGDEIISEIDSISSTGVVLKNPHQVTMVRPGQFGLLHYPLTSDGKELTIHQDFIMFTCEPGDEFINQYKSIIGVGIVVPPKDIILN